MTDIDWWAVGLHEAAHAVVYAEAGCSVVHLFIARTSDDRVYGSTKAPTAWNSPLLRATAALAGPVAALTRSE
jgi:hypothetical protein